MAEAASKAAPEPTKPVKLKNVKEDMSPADDTASDKPMLKQKMLATALSRSIVIAALIGSIAYVTASLLATRYSLTPSPNTNNSFVYRIDRLTGTVQFCGAQQCTTLANVDK